MKSSTNVKIIDQQWYMWIKIHANTRSMLRKNVCTYTINIKNVLKMLVLLKIKTLCH